MRKFNKVEKTMIMMVGDNYNTFKEQFEICNNIQ